ncbi:type VI secretion system tip protein TssI/VgrG [Fulvimarina sp. MAC3]|uniref:type VI secretion system Vgr family protein n=1 Tax=Fulvimarina sp. MAC3 TaxID=3148887 RepID=UPI0031FD6438
MAGEGGARPYRGVDRWHPGEEEHFREWHGGTRVTTGAVRLTEYNFKTPHAAQEVDRPSPTIEDRARMESFDWPGDYLDRGEGTGVVAQRLEEERGQAPRHRAKGEVAGLGAGMLVDLTGDPIPGVTGERFICLKATHRFRSQAYGSGSPDDEQRGYDGAFVLLPTDAPFRPERRTPRPFIKGPQTAVVVGDGEIDCDEYGRILVRYHWDLKGAYSMRCRVSQNWASKGWGGMVIPRIGMEVIVEHLEGDPDKPIVTGCVYNGANMAPYTLPANKTKSVFRSDTHKGSGFNEFTFEDEKGREEIYMHAERDNRIHIENSRTKRVDNNQAESIGHNKTIEVGNNHHEVIGGNMTLMVGPNILQKGVTAAMGILKNSMGDLLTDKLGAFTDKLGFLSNLTMGEGNLIVGVGKNKAETVMVSSTEIVGGAKTTTVGGGYQLSVQGIRHDSVLMGAYEEIGQNKTVVVGKTFELVCGDTKLRMESSGKVTIESKTIDMNASERITLKAGKIELN